MSSRTLVGSAWPADCFECIDPAKLRSAKFTTKGLRAKIVTDVGIVDIPLDGTVWLLLLPSGAVHAMSDEAYQALKEADDDDASRPLPTATGRE